MSIAPTPDYRISIRKTVAGYALVIEELSLIVESETLDGAYEALMQKKQELFSQAAALGFADKLSGPDGTSFQSAAARASQRRIWSIALATSGTAIVIAVFFSVAVSVALKQGQTTFARIADRQKDVIHYAMSEGIHGFKKALHKWAEMPEMPADEKRQMLQDIQTIVQRYKPIVDEALPLVSGVGAQPPSSSPKAKEK